MESDHPEIRRGWLNVARRLQSIARSQGYSILTIRILVDADNNPAMWSEPERVLVEPKSQSDRILALLTGGDSGGRI